LATQCIYYAANIAAAGASANTVTATFNTEAAYPDCFRLPRASAISISRDVSSKKNEAAKGGMNGNESVS
jgi:hypothetical protein